MINITTWLDGFLKALHDTFGNRVWFVGLQGSHGRGEATETSDIDVVENRDAAQSGHFYKAACQAWQNENVNTEVLVKICQALHCNVDEIMDISEPKENNA